jgi:hypothetical protein
VAEIGEHVDGLAELPSGLEHGLFCGLGAPQGGEMGRDWDQGAPVPAIAVISRVGPGLSRELVPVALALAVSAYVKD